MALTASPQSALPPGPSWDETIVPSLRKRLETESRILTKRLSTISITEEVTPTCDPASPNDNADAHLQRPSAIPRPSYSPRATASSPAGPSQKAEPPQRQRTLSTPFPFNDSALNEHSTTGLTSPSSSTSGSTSPRIQSPTLARAAPSRIPTVSTRTRSGSHSSQSVIAKSSLPPSHKFQASGVPTPEPISPDAGLRGKASFSSLTRQRIVDERPPFTNEPPPHVLEQEFTGRPSAEEERTYQHWYRGDVSRNGGVGEYRVGKRVEMLDIANYGHPLRSPDGRARTYEEPIPRSGRIGVDLHKRAESVSSRERASIYIDTLEDGSSRVLDETPLTDIEADDTDYDRDQYVYTHEPSAEFGMHQTLRQQQPNGFVQTLPTNHNRGDSGVGAPASLPMRLPSVKPQTRIPQAQVRAQPRKESMTSPPIAASGQSTAVKSNLGERGRPHTPKNSRAKPATKAKSEKRSMSAGDALQSAHDRRESADYTSLADAVPETRSPKPRDGNWDEVILPTVARRMGIEYEKEDPAAAAKRRARESRIAPAPGTFGYDHTKYKQPHGYGDIPMGEFGQQRPELAPDVAVEDELELPATQSSPLAPTTIALHSRRDMMPSPAPFSHYMTSPNPAMQPVSAPTGDRRRERQDMPQILVSPPTRDDRDPPVEEDERSGCCKCVVM